MSIEEVGVDNRSDFIAYCRKHRFDHDESWLSDHDLEAFDPAGSEEAALLFRDGSGRVRGAAALLLRPELLAAGKARFRILHVEAELGEDLVTTIYRGFVAALAPRAGQVEWLYLFLPEVLEKPAAILRDLGFSVERYAWLLERELVQLEPPLLPPGLAFREALLRRADGSPGPDAEAWCSIINEAFRELAGHTELLPTRLAGEIDPSLDFPGSWLLLEDRGIPIGLVATVRDLELGEGRGAFLGPVAVIPAYQGRGLGRAALRAGLGSAKSAACLSCCLSVNAENSNALRLYLGEHFHRKYVMVCWHRRP